MYNILDLDVFSCIFTVSPLPRMSKHRGPVRKPPSKFVRQFGAVNFGEGEVEEAEGGHFDEGQDESALPVDQDNDDEAIMV